MAVRLSVVRIRGIFAARKLKGNCAGPLHELPP